MQDLWWKRLPIIDHNRQQFTIRGQKEVYIHYSEDSSRWIERLYRSSRFNWFSPIATTDNRLSTWSLHFPDCPDDQHWWCRRRLLQSWPRRRRFKPRVEQSWRNQASRCLSHEEADVWTEQRTWHRGLHWFSRAFTSARNVCVWLSLGLEWESSFVVH